MALKTWLKKLHRPRGHDAEQVAEVSEKPSGKTTPQRRQSSLNPVGEQGSHFLSRPGSGKRDAR